MDKSKPILILGSNSFSGSSYANQLLSEEFSVIGVGRSKESISVYCPYKRNSNLHNFTFKQIDLNSGFEEIAELVSQNKIEYIFNFASQSMVAQSWHFPEQWYQTNVVGLSELCNLLLKEKSIKKFDYQKLEDTIDRRFAEYHTKQHFHYIDENRILINL